MRREGCALPKNQSFGQVIDCKEQMNRDRHLKGSAAQLSSVPSLVCVCHWIWGRGCAVGKKQGVGRGESSTWTSRQAGEERMKQAQEE